MRNIYIVNMTSRSIRYGIGTYIRQLIRCAQHAGMKVHYILISDEVKEFEVVEKNGVRHLNIPLSSYYGNGYSLNALIKIEESIAYLLKEFIDDDEGNIFHFNIMRQEALISRMKKQYKGKFVLTVHYTEWSFELLGDRKKLQQILNKRLDRMDFREKYVSNSFFRDKRVLNEHVDRVIAIARHSYDDIVGIYGAAPEKVTLVNNALPDKYRCLSAQQRSALRARYGLSPDENVIVFAGRLDEVKGIAILIRAFRLLLGRYPNSRLVVAGEGDFKELLAYAFGDWGKVMFTGYVNQRTLSDLYSVADIGVVPSLHEEFGYVAIEMMMHRLPVIVNATTGLAEIVDHETNGLHVFLKRGKHNLRYSAGELAKGMIRLSFNPDLRAELGRNARKKYLSRYAIRHFNEKMKSLYQTL
ncbi:TIGR04157 family glycosyltransferase [Alistipes hominis]|uniref:TIGR04157 family glycosyltransferase n=1 Tax=Alistipes hominis TaxID=2763015 RepID=A0ABR7CPP2_9BACT|nr:TIGR04157 family glycosyltransferase [Alistipes hominis]MBC5617569.1 TIGR04157 family glycosyltransferase [Alistipes hominis]